MTAHPHAHKLTGNPEWRKAMALAHAAPRCTARCRHSKRPCKNPAINGRPTCRMHGGTGGAPRGERNGAYRHGRNTIEAKELRSRMRSNRIRLAAMLAAFHASDGSEADLTAKLEAAGLL